MKTRFLITVLVIFFSLLPTGYASCEPEKPYGGTLRLSAITKPVTLNPILARDSVSTHLIALVFNSLVKLNVKGEIVGDLADSWNISKDRLTWTFKLKNGVEFQDGMELTSKDVLFTYKQLKEHLKQTSISPLLNMVNYFDAPDRYTFRVHLKRPYSAIIYLMFQGIIPEHAFKDKDINDPTFGKKPIGTGPFILSKWEKDSIIFRANKNYFRGRPYLDRVVVKFFPTRLSAWVALLKGDINLVSDLNYEDYRVIENDKRFKVYDYLSNFYYTILFNMKDLVYSNLSLRRAVSLAIDRRDIIENVLNGMGMETTGPFIPGSWAYNENVRYQTYNPEYAQKLLIQTGYRDTNGDMIVDKDGKDLTLNILLDRGDSIKKRLAKRIKWQLFKAGIRVNLRVVDRKTLFRKMLFPGKFQSVLLQFNVGAYPDKNTYLFWDSKNIGKFNIASYKNREVDRLIEQAWDTGDLKEKEKIYKKIHAIIAEDVPAVFLYYRRKYLAASSRIGGIRPKPEVIYRSISEWYIIKK